MQVLTLKGAVDDEARARAKANAVRRRAWRVCLVLAPAGQRRRARQARRGAARRRTSDILRASVSLRFLSRMISSCSLTMSWWRRRRRRRARCAAPCLLAATADWVRRKTLTFGERASERARRRRRQTRRRRSRISRARRCRAHAPRRARPLAPPEPHRHFDGESRADDERRNVLRANVRDQNGKQQRKNHLSRWFC